MKKTLLAILVVFSAGLAHAESPWSIKVGASDVIPKGNGGTLVGFSASTSNDIQFTPYGVALDIRKINIISKMYVDGKKVGDLVVDPWVVGLDASYKF